MYEEAVCATQSRMYSVSAVVRSLAADNEDFEWYPTTDEMIAAIRADMQAVFGDHYRKDPEPVRADVLDCGAGDGYTLVKLANGGRCLGIEKSETLLGLQPINVIPVGADFYTTTLIDKKVDVVFSNPPFTHFADWAEKIIFEANARLIYLILPVRWIDSPRLNRALERRQAKAHILYSGDFLDAERAARARIDIVKIDLMAFEGEERWQHRRRSECLVDPFRVWFEATFPKPEVEESDDSDYARQTKAEAQFRQSIDNALVQGSSLVETLSRHYQSELQSLRQNYAAAAQLSPSLMKELGIKYDKLIGSLSERLAGIKAKYWKELFRTYEPITSRLTCDSQDALLRALNENTHVDFNEDAALAITIWVLKNAGQYIDSQLVDLVDKMRSRANVTLYKSNQKTWRDEDWRYTRWNRSGTRIDRYKLDYRIVLENMGGIASSGFTFDMNRSSGLDTTAANFLADVCAVASTIGWTTRSGKAGVTYGRRWVSNGCQEFWTDDDRLLMDCRAFKKGTLHLRFNEDFIKALNVTFGRLMGWLRTRDEAAEELDMSAEAVAAVWNCKMIYLPEQASAFLLESKGP